MSEKHILLLGAGFVAGPFLDYMLRRPENHVTVACRHVDAAAKLAGDKPRCRAIALDVKDAAALKAEVEKHDVVVSLIPYTYHPLAIEAAVAAKKHFVSTSYVSPAMAAFDQAAKDANVTVLNEIGVDPGVDHLYAMKTIDEVHAAGGKVKEFVSFCGGLPAPEASNNPFGYKLSWSGRGVLLAARNPAKYFEKNELIDIPGPELLSRGPREVVIYPAFALEGYPNRDSTPYRERYSMPEAETVLRGTLRYKGNPALVKALADVGMLDDDAQDYLSPEAAEVSWLTVMGKVLGCAADEASVTAAVVAKANLADSPHKERIIRGFKWLGLLTDKPVIRSNSVLDTLAATLSEKLAYAPGERDMVLLQHLFIIEKADGSLERRTSTLLEYGIPNGATAMARTVGIPCGIACQLILDGKIDRRGVLAPLTKDIYEPIITLLKDEGIACKEEIEE